MTDAARELELYITNDGRLYKSAMLPIYKNLATKKAKGEFSFDLAIKAFKYVVDEGAKRYTLEHGSMTDRWDRLFPMSDRKQVAESFADFFVAEWKLGAFRDLLPKKYR